MHPNVHCNTIPNSQDMEATYMSIARWMDKHVVQIYNAILAIKISNNATCSNMDGFRDYHTKWSKSEKERQIPYDITYMWNLKYNTNEGIYKTDIDNRLWLPRGSGVEEGESGVSRCTPLYIGWINNKVILYSTRNYIQYSVINHNGNEYVKEYVWITLLYSRNEHTVNKRCFNTAFKNLITQVII